MAKRGRPPAQMCEETNRIRYPSRLDAMLQLLHLDRRSTPRGERGAYHCLLCGGWHLTSTHNRLKRAGRPRVLHELAAHRRKQKD